MQNNFDPSNSNLLGEEFSNFKFGKGKLREKLKNASKKFSKKIGDKFGGGKLVHSANKVNPAFIALRGGMSGMLKNNVVGLGHAFALIKENDKSRFEDIKQKFWMWGGDKNHLDKVVDEGKDKPAMFKELVDKFQKKSNEENKLNKGQQVAQSVFETFLLVKVLALAPDPTPVMKTVGVYLKSVTFGLKDLGGDLQAFAKENGASEKEVKRIPHVPFKFKKH